MLGRETVKQTIFWVAKSLDSYSYSSTSNERDLM